MKCLIIDAVHSSIAEEFSKYMQVDTHMLPTQEELAKLIPDYDVLIMRVDPAINKEILDAAKNLKVIGVCSVGLNHIDLDTAKEKGIPVINAGDGGHNHPTQTLTDLLTIQREKGRFNDLTVGFCGDLKFGRTVHSLIEALSRSSGIKFVLISPEELKLPSYIKKDVLQAKGLEYRQETDLAAVMPELDILYMTRVQRERFFNEEDYLRLKDSYILTPEKLAGAKADLRILHPLPRVNEISTAIDADPRACYFRQALCGKFVRMALILKLLEA